MNDANEKRWMKWCAEYDDLLRRYKETVENRVNHTRNLEQAKGNENDAAYELSTHVAKAPQWMEPAGTPGEEPRG